MKLVVLAGGGGTRLFPLSRRLHPKQFLKLTGRYSLLQETLQRFQGLFGAEDIIVVTNEDYAFHVRADLKELGLDGATVLCEPTARNTAPAIALAAAYCRDSLQCAPSELVFVTAADQLVRPARIFQERAEKLLDFCSQNAVIALMGVKPRRPDTSFGYIQVGEEIESGIFRAKSFWEKPGEKAAADYVAAGDFYWNAGVFCFSLGVFWEELAAASPEIMRLMGSYEEALGQFALMPDISLDCAVAEKSRRLCFLPLDKVEWSDIGSFDAIAEVMGDVEGNAFIGDVLAEDCKGTLVWGKERLIGAIGIEDMLVVDTPDALLISRRGRGQEVGALVSRLKRSQRQEVEAGTTVYRPWGSYTTLATGEGYKVKRIVINPGDMISLQLHYHRSEHWTVVSGTGKVTVDDRVVIFRENESTYIPIGARHRLENPGQLPLIIIEVQNGKYLGEDDIVRLEDVYGRK